MDKEILLEIKNCSIFQRANNSKLVEIEKISVKNGDIIFIIGENGFGKSSIVKSFFSQDAEETKYLEIKFEDGYANMQSSRGYGLDLREKDSSGDNLKWCETIAYLSQESIFYSSDTIMDALHRYASIALGEMGKSRDYKLINSKIKKISDDYALKYLKDIYRHEDKYIKGHEDTQIALEILNKKKAINCSFGQQKMISLLSILIKTIVFEVDLLVLDEPLNYLDSKNKKNIVSLLSNVSSERANKNKPLTLIIISHCLVFPFIKKSNCYEYEIKEKKLILHKGEKIFHNCLE